MNMNPRLRSSRFLLRPTFTDSGASLPTKEKLGCSSSRYSRSFRVSSNTRSRILTDSFTKTQKLQKSLESIRAKRQEVELMKLYLNEKHKQVQRIRRNFFNVSQKFEAAAIKIQKVFRGFITRKKFKPIIVQHLKTLLKKNLTGMAKKVSLIWRNLYDINEAAIIIQKSYKGYCQRKKYKSLREIKRIQENVFITHCALVIQRRFKEYKINKKKKEDEEFNRKIEGIKARLREIKVKVLWEKRKFNWKAITNHYGLACQMVSIVDHSKVSELSPSRQEVANIEIKPKKKFRKKQKTRPKPKLKSGKCSCLRSSSIASRNNESSLNSEINNGNFLSIPSKSKPRKSPTAELSVSIFDNSSELDIGLPLEKIKNLFKESDLNEEQKKEILKELTCIDAPIENPPKIPISSTNLHKKSMSFDSSGKVSEKSPEKTLRTSANKKKMVLKLNKKRKASNPSDESRTFKN